MDDANDERNVGNEDDHRRTDEVEDEIELIEKLHAVVARKTAHDLIEVPFVRAQGTDNHESEEECRRPRHTEGKRQKVNEAPPPSSFQHTVRVKDQNVPFNRNPRHQKQADAIQREL